MSTSPRSPMCKAIPAKPRTRASRPGARNRSRCRARSSERAAATAFQQLLSALHSAYLHASASDLVARDGSIGIGARMTHRTSYAKLIAGQQISLDSNGGAA